MIEKSVSQSIHLAVLMPFSENSFWRELQDRFACLAGRRKLDLQFFRPQGQDPVNQADCLRQILNKGFDLIIVNPANDNALAEAIFEAAAKSVYVLDVGMKMKQDLVRKAVPYYVPLRAADFLEQGKLGASYIAARLAGAKLCAVAVVEGRRDAFQSNERCRGACEVFSRTSAVERVGCLIAGFDRTKARELGLGLLRGDPAVKACFCANDEMALGIADAVDSVGGLQDFIVVGVDGTQAGCRAVMDGRISATVAFSRREVARAVLDAAFVVLKKEAPKFTPVKSVLLTRENAITWSRQESGDD